MSRRELSAGRSAHGSPMLSVVVTTRNDDHGGDLLRRTQIFLDGLIEQARRHNLQSELIIVEWNPPADRPRLADALAWPREAGPCRVRIIEVPATVHRRYNYSDRLPLFQMIAKNVGVRRARGRFVLCTNVDLLFSDALIDFLASGRLSPGCLYRIDRLDVPASIPVGSPVAEQLAYCQRHVIRINTRWGTFVTNGRTSLSVPAMLWIRSAEFLRARQGGTAEASPLALVHGALRWVRRVVERSRSRLRKGSLRAMGTPDLRKIVRWVRNEGLTVMATAVRSTWIAVMQQLRTLGLSVRAVVDLVRYWWPKPLHTNGCGDFTLLSRARWHMLRGYPEVEIFSLHLDSILCHMAVLSGAREAVLRGPMRVYHVEHGSGWSPEEATRLLRRIRGLGVPVLDVPAYRVWIDRLRKDREAAIENDEGWGLASEELLEIDPMTRNAGYARRDLLETARG